MLIFGTLGFLALGNFSTFAAWLSLRRFGSLMVDTPQGQVRPSDPALWLAVSLIYQLAIEIVYSGQIYSRSEFLPWNWIWLLYLLGLIPLLGAMAELRRFPSFAVPGGAWFSASAVRAAVLLAMLIHLVMACSPLALVGLLRFYPIRWM